ncbi:hypothetical protein NKI01_15680 [Mesorhizobium sp. M0815]|uniref:hypothetical protein n=1 Tax=Mesorhizobium sp. M0815 TaxID=2957005 RepID=UPI003336B3FF
MPTQLRPDLFFRLDTKVHFPAKERMQRASVPVQQMRRLSSVDNNDAFVMLDGPGEGRQPAGPVPVGKDAGKPMAASFDLGRLDADRPGPDGMYFHFFLSIR